MARHHLALAAAALLVLLPLAGCGGGGSDPTPNPTGIGPAGGTVTGPNGAELIVPAGALSATVDLRLVAAEAASLPAAVSGVRSAGAAYTATPHGQAFASPVTLRIPYDAAALVAGEQVALLTAQPGGGWSVVPGTTTAGGFVEAQVDHLSHFAPGAPMAFRKLSGPCGLTHRGEIWCWGSSELTAYDVWTTPRKISGDLAFTDFTTGGGTACAIGALGRISCLGYYNGDDVVGASTTFTPIASDLSFRQVTGFNMHFCAIAESTSEAWCWGSNMRGQLGTGQVGSLYDSSVPVRLGGAFATTGWASLAAGGQFTCGVTNAGDLYCWGDNTWRQLGVNAGEYTGTPTLVGDGVSRVWASATHACAQTGSSLRCWGHNDYGQVGDGTGCNGSTPCVNNTKFPATVVGLTLPAPAEAAVTLSPTHTCARTSSANTLCWGRSYKGATGSGVTPVPDQQLEALPVAGGYDFMELAAQGSTTCGITSAGGAWCWGENTGGQLCIGSTDSSAHPTPARMKLTGLP